VVPAGEQNLRQHGRYPQLRCELPNPRLVIRGNSPGSRHFRYLRCDPCKSASALPFNSLQQSDREASKRRSSPSVAAAGLERATAPAEESTTEHTDHTETEEELVDDPDSFPCGPFVPWSLLSAATACRIRFARCNRM